jgi:3-dehydroshikimate dehydratase
MIKFSAFADEVSDDFEEQVAFLVSEHISNIEIRSLNHKNIMELNKLELIEARQLLGDNGISVSAIGSPIGKTNLDQPFETHLDKFRHAIELADFFNAPYIRVFSYYAPDGEYIDDFREEVLRRMRIQADLLKGSEIVMVHENEAHIYGHSAENCVDIASSVNSPNLKLVYDPANFVWGSNIVNNMDRCWPLMEPYVVHVHIKDWVLGSTNIGSIPGQGDGQIRELIQKLCAIDYNGFLTLEPHLESGGQFGGRSGAALFKEALAATRKICDEENLKYS